MRILILSFYFPPDLSAGSFRTSALVDAFRRLAQPGLTVDVITTQPNRYSQIARSVESLEEFGWLTINRIDLPSHKSGMRDQAQAYAAFSKGVLKLTKRNDWDVVYATSSRLMTAALGAYIAKRKKLPLYLDIRDLFLDTMKDVLNNSYVSRLLPLFKCLEKITFQRAAHINLVSEGFLTHISEITSINKCSVFTNGIDNIFMETDFRKPAHTKAKQTFPRILYAGNIGEGQGLHNILPKAALALKDSVQFHIVGDGGRAAILRSSISSIALRDSAIKLHPPVPREKLLEEYRQADILFLHLNDYEAFTRVLPSKIFEYAATGKPIVAGVAGHAAVFLKQHVSHAEVFDPCDVNGMITAVKAALQAPSHIDRTEFCRKFERTTIMDKMARDILAYGP